MSDARERAGQDAVFDLLVVGAGPTGLASAIEAKKTGFRVVLVDKGCVCNSIFHYPAHMTFFTTSELLEIGGIPFPSPNAKPTRNEALEYYRQVAAHYQLDIRQYQRVERVSGIDGDFTVQTTDRFGRHGELKARKLALSIGYYDLPNWMGHSGRNTQQSAPLLPRSPSLLRHGRCCDRRQEFRGHCRAGIVASRCAGHGYLPRTKAYSPT